MQVNLRKLAGGLSAVLMIATGVTAIAPTVAATASSSTSFADATAYGMNAGHTGVSSDPVGPDWAVKWSKTEGGAVDYPVIANGEVVVLAGGSAPTLTAYAASTGDQLWQDAVATASLGMTYQSGRVFVQSGGFSAVMSAYDITTGNLDWSASIPGQYSFSSAPTAANGIVYTDGAGSGGTLYAFNQNNGALLWTGEVTNGDDSSPAVDANGVYASFACDLTQAFNASSGTPLWTHEFACEGGGGQTAVLADGDVFLRDLILNASTGAIVRSFRSGPTPAVDNQNVYAETSGTLRASTIGSGSVLWSQAADGGLDTAPIDVNGVVYDGSSSGHVYGFSALTGQQVANLTIGTPVESSGVNSDSAWGLSEGDGLLAVPAGNTITIFGQSGVTPSAPTGVSATAGNAQATVDWTVPADNGNPITDYTITPFVAGVAQTPLVVAAGTAGSATDPTPGASDQATVPDLTDGTSYTFTVQADNRVGPGTASNPTPAITPAAAPTAPANVSAEAGRKSALVRWTVGSSNGSAITSFVFTTYQNGVGSGAHTVVAGAPGTSLDPTPGAADSYEITGLTGGTPMTITVAAVNAVGEGAESLPSAQITPTTGPTVPYAPTDVRAQAVSASEPSVTWTVPKNNGAAIGSFVIKPTSSASTNQPITVPAGAVGSNLDPTPGATDSYTISGLPSASYTFTVAAANSVGSGPVSSPSNAVAVATVPSAPTGVSESSGQLNTATVVWTVPASNGAPITSFSIVASHAGSSSTHVVPVGTVGSSLSPTPGANDSYTLSGLEGGSWTFGVSATNAFGSGPGSTVVGSVPALNPARLVASTTSVNLGRMTLGDVGPGSTFTLSNEGGAAVVIQGFSFSGDDDFVEQSDCTTLEPAQSCTVDVFFLPGAVGLRRGTLAPLAGAVAAPTIALTGTGTEGYYVATASGAVHAFGDAVWKGDLSHAALAEPIVSMVGTGDDDGYWMVASDGGIFAFGDARFYGSTGGIHLAKPIVGMTVTPDGGGYWMVASDGGIFAFGDARFYGSTGGIQLAKPIVGMTVTPDGGGYWMVASDGGIFAFGDAKYYGSTGGGTVNNAVVMTISGASTLQALLDIPA
jgi:titin